VLTESTRRSGDGSLFHARGVATANKRSPSDDVVRGTATEPDVADLKPALAVAAADGVMRSDPSYDLMTSLPIVQLQAHNY